MTKTYNEKKWAIHRHIQHNMWLSKIVPRCPTHVVRRQSQTWASKRI